MNLIRGLVNLHTQSQPCVATIGNFDGVHLGHQAIVERVLSKSRLLSVPSCVLLFEPHPKEFFLGENCPPRLTCLREKYQQLQQLGVDKLVVLQFNQPLRKMPAAEFVSSILIEKLRVKHLVVGDDFKFGHQRKGNYQLLEQMASGHYSLEPTPSVIVNGERVSSTLIRDALTADNLDKASALTGRRFSLTGKVGYGQQLGRKLNFPTANVAIKRKKMPINGVFLAKCHWIQDGRQHSAWSAVNCGSRPTVDGVNYRLEVHLLGVSPSLYGIELTVDFYALIRKEAKFSGISELRVQIAKDVDAAKRLIGQFEN